MDLTKRLKEMAQNEIRLDIGGPAPREGQRTRFGGTPDLPPGFEWPVYSTDTYDDPEVKERPLTFLAQLDCRSLAPFDADGLLPHSGVLSFFYEYQSQKWGFDPKDEGCARVFWFEDAEGLRPAPFPQALPQECRLPSMGIGLERGISLPSGEDAALGWQRDFDYDEFEAQSRMMGYDPPETSSKLLGWADLIQGNITSQCQLVTQGYYLGGLWEDIPEEHVKYAEEKSLEQWRLLFQLDTVTQGDFELMFGDCGRLYFYIRPGDLAARRFDRVWTVLQCY